MNQKARLLHALETLVSAIDDDCATMGGCGELTRQAHANARALLDYEEVEDRDIPDDTPCLEDGRDNCNDWGTGEGQFHGRI